MKKIILLFISSFALFAADPVKVAPENILFLAHYDQSTEPAAGNTENAQCLARITSGTKGFPFKNGDLQEALDANGYGKYHLMPGKGNFNPVKGTIQMWILPKWSTAKGEAHNAFFQLVPTPDKRNQFNWRLLHFRKPPKKMVFTCWGNSKKETPIASVRSDGWIQLAVTWDWSGKKGIRCFYVNGELVDKVELNKKFFPIDLPGEIMIGAPKGWNAKSLLDEVRILNYPLTAAEIKQDFDANMEGKPFPSPSAMTEAKAAFQPEKVAVSVASASVKTDAKEVFKAVPVARDFKVDGDLDKEVWKKAEVITGLRPVGKSNDARMKNRTELRLLYSAEALYLGVKCWQDMSKMTAQYDQDEMPVWNDDNLDLFFDIAGKGAGLYQFCINPLGSTTDLKDGKKAYFAAGRETKAKRFDDRWEVEIKIPFAAFDMMRPFSGDYIGFRMCRSVKRPHDAGSIPQLKTTGNNRRISIGKLLFTSGSGESPVQLTSAPETFLPGVNTLTFTLKNQDKTPFKGELLIQAQNRKGQLSKLASVPLEIKEGGELKREVKIPVRDTGIVKLVASAISPAGEAGLVLLQPGFAYAAPGAEKMLREATAIRNTLAFLSDAEHPVYRTAFASIDSLLEQLRKFNTALEDALKNGTAVPAELCEETASNIAGFRKYMDANRYLVWQTSPWESTTPDVLPSLNWKADEPLELTFKQASNEREAVCLVFSGLFCGTRLQLRVVPQSIKIGRSDTISCDNFEVYTEEFVNDYGDVIPSPLIPAPGNYITVTPGKPVRVWVMFNSRGVKPGKYQTKLLVKSAYDKSIATRAIPVSVNVWNFTLPETHEWPLQSFMWGPNYFTNDECETLRMFHDCHMTHGWTRGFNYITGFKGDYQRANWPLPKGTYFREELVKTANQKFFETAKELKMKFVFGWNLPTGNTRWFELMAERLDAMGFKPGDYVFKALIADEFVKRHIPAHAAIRQKIADMNKGWYFQAVYLSTPPPVGATMDDIEAAKLPEFYKIWTVIRGLLRDPKRGPEIIRRLKAKGCEVWSYSCSLNMAKQSLLDYYRLYCWECYLKELAGVAWWCAISPHGDDGFAQDDGKDEGVLLRGINKKPVPTRMLQAIREGLEDVAYMDRLKKELARVQAAGKKFPEYEQLIKDCAGIMKRSRQSEVDAWRLKAGEAIDRLTRE
ncbi:MAG: hypothetical protein IJS14_07465 [Lentisphaeria bacterium]|nr:hypothetical protein [Lentisphaeria bacterium]